MSHIDVGNLTALSAFSVPIVSATETVDVAPALRRFSVDEYHRLGELGILACDERTELLEGIITMMAPIGLPHGQGVLKTLKTLERIVPKGWQALSQQSITLDGSEPVPDVIVIRGDLLTYTRLPQAQDLGLVVEVSEATLRQDRKTKVRIYAAAGIPEYWIVNLVDKKLEVHCRPTAAAGDQPARYETVEAFGAEQSANVVLDGMQVGAIAVRDVLP